MIDNQQTLFERVGGEQTVAELIDQFYDRVVADPERKPFFTNVSMVKLRRMQREFFGAALDGPTNYTGRPLGYVHYGKAIVYRALQRP
jgi:hemoglobin